MQGDESAQGDAVFFRSAPEDELHGGVVECSQLVGGLDDHGEVDRTDQAGLGNETVVGLIGKVFASAGGFPGADRSAASRSSGSDNAAVAQIISNDYNGARNTLAAIKFPNAMTAYLGAILAARTNDRDAVYSNLRNAVQLDRNFIKKALNDLEFAKYFADTTFLSILK